MNSTRNANGWLTQLLKFIRGASKNLRVVDGKPQLHPRPCALYERKIQTANRTYDTCFSDETPVDDSFLELWELFDVYQDLTIVEIQIENGLPVDLKFYHTN